MIEIPGLLLSTILLLSIIVFLSYIVFLMIKDNFISGVFICTIVIVFVIFVILNINGVIVLI